MIRQSKRDALIINWYKLEGRCVKTTTGWQYQYHIKDHLGNVRVSFDQTGNIIQSDSYYPHGQRMGGISFSSAGNKYLFGGKELQDDAFTGTAFDLYDYGARWYDPQIGRWHGLDILAEWRADFSPYNFCQNNPILRNDPRGMLDDIHRGGFAAFGEGSSAGMPSGPAGYGSPPTYNTSALVNAVFNGSATFTNGYYEGQNNYWKGNTLVSEGIYHLGSFSGQVKGSGGRPIMKTLLSL